MRKQNQSHLRAIQPKIATFPQKPKQPVAPPVYRPQPVPRVLQTKKANSQPQAGNLPCRPLAPPVYRPEAKPNAVQQKTASPSQLKTHSAAPPAYRPQPVPKVLQSKAAGGRQQPLPRRQPATPPSRRLEQQKSIQPKMGTATQPEKNSPPKFSRPPSQTHGAVRHSGVHAPNPRNAYPVIQRMIWRIDAPDDDETSIAITAAVQNALSTNKGGVVGNNVRGEVITHKYGLKSIPLDETLYILAHGDGTKVGGKKDTELAPNLGVWLPKGYRGKIKLVSCLTASVMPEETNSYARWVSHLLDFSGRPNLSVQGMDGVADVDSKTGKIIVYNTSDYIKWMDEPSTTLTYRSGKGVGAKLRFNDSQPVAAQSAPQVGEGLGVGASMFQSKSSESS